MNILIIGKFYVEGFALHIADTLGEMGHSVIRFEPGYRIDRLEGKFGQRFDQIAGSLYSTSDSIPKIRAHRMKRLWRLLESHTVKIVIVCSDFLWPAEVAELKRRTGGVVAMWFPDHLANIGRGLFMNASYDALFFKDPYIVYRLGQFLRSPCFYLPECFNPEKHWLPEEALDSNPVYECDIGTAGNSHAYRIAFFQHLDGYDVKQWGNYPPLWLPTGAVAGMHQGRQVLEHEKVRAFRGAKIVINNLHYGEIWGVNVRTFEAAGTGAFQMVDWQPGLQQLFNDGRELITFRTMQELKEKIDYWLPREGERRAIGQAAMKRAHAEHTYRHRLELLLSTLIDGKQGFPVPDIRICA